jgi:hypothetical protein
VGPRGTYGAFVAGAPSDKVWGMDLPCSHHVNFRFTWQWTVAGHALPATEPDRASFPRLLKRRAAVSSTAVP